MLTLRITPEDLEAAKNERYQHLVPKVCIRMTILCHLAAGETRSATAKLAGVSTKTVKRCIQLYNEQGLEGIRKLHYKGPKSEMDAYRTSIESSFKTLPPRTAKEAAARIKELTGLEVTAGRVLVFMKGIGMKCLKMGHIPAKADSVKQREFHDDILAPLIADAKDGKCHLFYVDAAHFTLSPFVCMVWCFARVFLKAAAGRNRINVLGAIHATTHRLESVINTTYITSTQVVELIERLAENYVSAPIFLLMDNARYQHCAYVMERAALLHVNLVFLPPYSPNLNIIERLWKYLREKVLYGKYYDDAQKFHEAIRSGVGGINTCPEWKTEVAARLTPSFQFFEN